jgi:fused signal recognition particle receptor
LPDSATMPVSEVPEPAEPDQPMPQEPGPSIPDPVPYEEPAETPPGPDVPDPEPAVDPLPDAPPEVPVPAASARPARAREEER